jgi:hypothetical protein
MPEGRDDIPLPLQRALMVEAGHRCAIPTCREVAPLHIEHIEDWARVKEHRFENMIVLCANCHGRKGSGPRSLDRKSLKQYKANLALINSRYSSLERRVLEFFAEFDDGENYMMSSGLEVLMMYLVKDGLVVKKPVPGDMDSKYADYWLTEAGKDFISRLRTARPVSDEAEP